MIFINYILNKDFTYKKTLDVTKIDTKDMKYLLLDISTERKGPLFTIVKDNVFDYTSKHVKIVLYIHFVPLDLPFAEDTMMISNYTIDSINKYYNIYPLICQMTSFNLFSDLEPSFTNYLFISEIVISYDGVEITISDSNTDKDVRKTFKKLNMMTHTSKVLDDKCLILYKNKWEVVSINEDEEYLLNIKFDKIGIMIPYTESLYLMTYKEFQLFHKIKSVEFELCHESDKEEYDQFYDGESYISSSYVNSFGELISAFLYIPQAILMDNMLFDSNTSLKITVETKKGHMLSVIIDSNEIKDSKNTCMYYIIKKLLKI